MIYIYIYIYINTLLHVYQQANASDTAGSGARYEHRPD